MNSWFKICSSPYSEKFLVDSIIENKKKNKQQKKNPQICLNYSSSKRKTPLLSEQVIVQQSTTLQRVPQPLFMDHLITLVHNLINNGCLTGNILYFNYLWEDLFR